MKSLDGGCISSGIQPFLFAGDEIFFIAQGGGARALPGKFVTVHRLNFTKNFLFVSICYGMEALMEKLSAAILCGGKSIRMGKDKARLSLDGREFLQRIEQGLSGMDEVLLSVGEDGSYRKTGSKHVTDQFTGCGPLAGIHAALRACRNQVLFVVTCDMPFADGRIAEDLYPYLSEGTDIVIPVGEDGHRHVLCGLYRKRTVAELEECLEKGMLKVRDVLDGANLKVRYVPVRAIADGERKMMNINTPEEYRRMIERYEKPQIPVYSFIAYSGTGKTTFIEKLIPELKKQGLRVAVIKHDGHDFEMDKEGKDTWRMTRAGADVTGIISAKKAAIMENRPLDFEDLLRRIKNVDVVLAEGFKTGDWPKIMIHRAGSQKPMPLEPQKCLAVVSDVRPKEKCRHYGLTDVGGVAELIMGHMKQLR